MGGKSSSSQKTSNNQHTNNIVNDGDYAGVGGNVTHDESRIDFEDDHSFNIENDIDNSVRVENDIDNSVENDGQFAGSSGNITILDGGAIEGAFDFGKEAIKENSKVTSNAIGAVERNSEKLVKSLVESQDNAFRSYDKVVGESFSAVNNATDKTLEALENVSGEYASNLTDFSNNFAEGISAVQIDNMSNNKEQLATIAELAKSTSLQGQDIVAENSTKMILYVMGGIAFLALIGGVVVLIKGNK